MGLRKIIDEYFPTKDKPDKPTKEEIKNRSENPEMLLTLGNFLKIGGNPEKGIKLFTNPNPDGVNYLIEGNFYTEHTNFYTFEELTSEGVKVEEKEVPLVTGWLFLTIPINKLELKN